MNNFEKKDSCSHGCIKRFNISGHGNSDGSICMLAGICATLITFVLLAWLAVRRALARRGGAA